MDVLLFLLFLCFCANIMIRWVNRFSRWVGDEPSETLDSLEQMLFLMLCCFGLMIAVTAVFVPFSLIP
jgi:hypothetical protein